MKEARGIVKHQRGLIVVTNLMPKEGALPFPSHDRKEAWKDKENRPPVYSFQSEEQHNNSSFEEYSCASYRTSRLVWLRPNHMARPDSFFHPEGCLNPGSLVGSLQNNYPISCAIIP